MIKDEVSSYWKYTFTILLIFLAVTVVLNSIMRSHFYEQSLQFIKDFQARSNNSLVIFMNLLSLLVNTNFLIAILAIIYISHKSKVASLVFLTNFLLNTYLMNLLKFSYQEPRPFWYTSSVKELEWGCPNQFGNPSGHSWMVVQMYQPLITDFIGGGFWNLAYTFPVIAGVLVPISRMFLGVHAGNEVVMGVTIGVIMCTLYRLKLQEWMYNLFFKLESKNVSLYGLIGLASINIIAIIAPIIIYSVNSIHRLIPQIYLDNLNNACGKQYTSNKIQEEAFEAHALVNIVFGFLFGAAATDPSNYNYFLGEWMFTSLTWPGKVVKFVYKLILQALIAGPIPLIFCFILPKYVEMNPYVKYIIECLGFWLFGFILVSMSNRVLVKAGAIIHYREEVQQLKGPKAISEGLFVSDTN